MTSAQRASIIAEVHHQWTMRNLDKMPFDPAMLSGQPDDDYPEHHLTVSATAEQQADLIASLRDALG